jgi:hypothetical protein
MADHGSGSKMPIVTAISLNAAGHPIHVKISQVSVFTSDALANWARQKLSSRCSVLSDGLACFRSVVAADCSHILMVTGERHPNNLPQFRGNKMLLGNRRKSFSSTSCLQLREICQAQSRWLLFPFQQAF